MNLEIILVGIVVGIANFASRFGPFSFIQEIPKGFAKARLTLARKLP